MNINTCYSGIMRQNNTALEYLKNPFPQELTHVLTIKKQGNNNIMIDTFYATEDDHLFFLNIHIMEGMTMTDINCIDGSFGGEETTMITHASASEGKAHLQKFLDERKWDRGCSKAYFRDGQMRYARETLRNNYVKPDKYIRYWNSMPTGFHF